MSKINVKIPSSCPMRHLVVLAALVACASAICSSDADCWMNGACGSSFVCFCNPGVRCTGGFTGGWGLTSDVRPVRSGLVVAPRCVSLIGQWGGSQCNELQFKPVTFPQGYGMMPNVTSWGGNIVADPAGNGYHLFVAEMVNHCPLSVRER